MNPPSDTAPEKTSKQRRLALRAFLGIVFLFVGFALVLPRPHHERTFRIEAGGCQMDTTVIEPAGANSSSAPLADASGTTSLDAHSAGTVVLLHGLAANRKLMSYLAEGFALQGLRVFVPDLPGHGHTAGPFSPVRDEECAENLLHELRSRGLAPPESTILAGHSMGGAIAIRIGARVPVAAVIAISPAPMRAAHGTSPDVLLFDNPPLLPPNTEIISGTLEPEQMTANARDLLLPGVDVNSHFELVPFATHAGLLFRPQVVRLEQAWAASVLHLDASGAPTAPSGSAPGHVASRKLPPRWPLLGCLLGIAGMLIIAGPFLREATGKNAFDQSHVASAQNVSPVQWWRATAEILLVGILVTVLLRYWEPLRVVRVFQADYLAGFLLFSGVLLIALHWRHFTETFDLRNFSTLRAMFAAMVLFLLFSAWFELSPTESWLDGARWQRFPLLFLTILPALMAEELLLGPVTAKPGWTRLFWALFYRLLWWLPLVFGILLLHSGEVLLVLLAPYMALFCIAHRRGMDVVREVTGSPASAAVFGAILLAGFFLVIFPLL
jgi:pimeloyl-ACP methyl ester carboxylesterase